MFTLQSGKQHAVGLALRGREGGYTAELSGECSCSIRASQGGGDKPHVLTVMQVRRLTPVECHRLMGWPDDWCAWGINDDGKRIEIADGPQYKMIGNGVGKPHAEWIGRRMMEVA
jgi:DNA (cytosine-5)-methyltransferase 1